MIEFLVGAALLAAGGFVVYTLTKNMPEDTRLKLWGATVLAAAGAAILG